MKNDEYWQQRSAWNMYHYMEQAEIAADQIAEVYLKSSRWLSYKAEEIFVRFMTKHELTETEARQLLSKMQDRTSLDEMLRVLQSEKSEERKRKLLTELEAPAYQARLERLRQLQNQIDIVMQQVYQQEKNFQTKFYVDLANEAYYRSIFDIQQRAGYAFSFNHINKKQIDSVLSMNWSGMHYSNRIWKNTEGLARTLKEELLINLLTGRTERETAQIIANKFAQGANTARRLVRTESNFLSTELNFKAYEEAGIEEYQFLATLDLKTSKICQSLDGEIFSVKDRKVGTNCPPMHPWCRSTTISVVNREQKDDMTRDALDPVTGKRKKVPQTMKYAEWYEEYVKGKPEAELEEKKIKNRFSDKKQYEKYKEILGDNVPNNLDDFQEMKYNDGEKWKFTQLDYQRRKELIDNPNLRLPNAENAVLPEAKFTKYLFGGNHAEGLAKGKAFETRLGYTSDNWEKLRSAIQESAGKYPVIFRDNNGYGDRYEQKIILYGIKGTPANVVVGWLHKLDNTLTMSSVYIKEVKGK